MWARNRRRGASMIEYMGLIVMIIMALYVFKDYIKRGFSGRWKTVGESYGFARQYSPTNTVECAYDPHYRQAWYDVLCVESYQCPFGDGECKKRCYEDATCISNCPPSPAHRPDGECIERAINACVTQQCNEQT